MHLTKEKNQGFVALVTLVVMTALVLLLAYSAGTLGLGELQMGFTAQKGLEALSVTEGCADEVLRRLRKDANYGVGGGTIVYTLSYGSCSLTVTNPGGTERDITITGTTSQYNKKIYIVAQATGSDVTVDSWAEQTN